ILVAEVGYDAADDQMFHIVYDGTVFDHRDMAVLGGDADAITQRLQAGFADDLDLAAAVRLGATALAGPDRNLPPNELEVAHLARGNGRRCFRRVTDGELADILGAG